MKSILSVTLSFFLVCSLTPQNCESASLIPTLPHEVRDPLTSTHFIEDGTEVDFTQMDTIITGLDLLTHDFSYNCLSGNFILAVLLDNSTTAKSDFFLNGTIGEGLFSLNASGVGMLDCHTEPDQRCLIIIYGDIVEQSEEGVVRPSAQISAMYVRTTAEVTGGFVGETPIEEAGAYFTDFVKYIHLWAVIENVETSTQEYINGEILRNMTMNDLSSLAHATCSSSTKTAILPEIPADWTMEPSVVDKIDSFNNLTFKTQRTLSGFDDIVHDFTYNCITTGFELTMIVKNFLSHGPFHMEGSHDYGTHDLNATGQMTEICPEEDVTPEGWCKLIVSGYITQDGENGSLVVDTFSMFYPLHVQLLVEHGMVDGHDWEEDQVSIDLLNTVLNSFIYDLRNEFYDVLEAQFNSLFNGMTMTELITLTGGTCV